VAVTVCTTVVTGTGGSQLVERLKDDRLEDDRSVEIDVLIDVKVGTGGMDMVLCDVTLVMVDIVEGRVLHAGQTVIVG
jgi:hypothetical protein